MYKITINKEYKLTYPKFNKADNPLKLNYSTLSFPCFTQEQVKEINREIKKNIFEKEKLDDAADYATKIGDFFHIPCTPPLVDLLRPWLYKCQDINRSTFGYDIYWDFHIEALNYNIYGKNGKYGWHIDANVKSLYDMKLTCLLNLSEESYEGGGFCVINAQEEAKFDSGMGLIINSLMAHKVTPITKGERITLAYWGLGPSWR